jgi:hypothetical protein
VLLEQARKAHREGKLREAVALAQKAQELFPASAEIRETFRLYYGLDRKERDARINRAVARVVIDEALDQADVFLREGQHARARDLAMAVQRALDRFPELEARAIRQGTERIRSEAEAAAPAEASEPEIIAAPPRPVADGTRSPEPGVRNPAWTGMPPATGSLLRNPNSEFRLRNPNYRPAPATYPMRPLLARPRLPEPEPTPVPEYLQSGRSLLGYLEELLTEQLLPP